MSKPILELEIKDLSRGGAGVGKDASGRIVFVPFSAPGDFLKVEILEEKKKFAQGRILEILKPSPLRIQPKCAVFGKCGGCEWQHLPYPLQWETKVKGIAHALERVKIESPLPILEFPAEKIWEYRNRIQLRSDRSTLGFFARGSQNLVAAERCEIADQKINESWGLFRREAIQKGRPSKLEAEVREGKVSLTWNSGHAAQGFRQIHDDQNEKLKAWVKNNVGETERIFDLFGGDGNLSLQLADGKREIECVDVSSPINEMKKLPPRFSFHRAPVLSWILKKTLATPVPTTAILDPPREGLGDDVSELATAFQKIGVNRILLIGCEADSWARDISRLAARGWKARSIGVLDLFPQTHHCEALAVMTR